MGCTSISHGRWSLTLHGELLPHGGYSVSNLCIFRQRRHKPCSLKAATNGAFLSFLELDLNSGLTSLREFLTTLPNVSAITVLALALTAVGRSLKEKRPPNNEDKLRKKDTGVWQEIGGTSDYWLLTLNPTPFNRFIIARCPSICFDGECNVDEDVYQKLNLESHQVVNVQNSTQSTVVDTRIDYQRRCIPTEDGGTLALDWPTCLELDGDHGLDTTLLLIPGTAKGSEDETVKVFVQRALKSGYFPVILNPRGCGNSPLTTPRIYTAGDSEDIRTAVSYIAHLRPWTTLMGIALGFGANMLTKYLGEEENLTPLTAAVAINNPFDLDEATKFMKHNQRGAFDKELTDGFVSILKSNKLLFQGDRNLDVAGGLTATSLREFETAISCPANGFKSLESFYRTVSSRRFIDQVKTPLLCIQDNTATPLYSISHESFEGNPYTTLLYTSMELKCLECNLSIDIALEWLAAVEIALLKGRHPLLRAVDMAIKPLKEWNTNFANALIEGTVEGNEYITVEPRQDFWAPEQEHEANHDSTKEENAPKEHVAKQEEKQDGKQEEQDGKDSENSEESKDEKAEEEKGQAQQAAKTIFGALDVVMPGTLSDETKEQVLEAVGRGETVITALQNAVPEDVRGKMATAVSAAVQARGMSLQLVGFGKSLPPPTLPAGFKENIQEKLASISKGGSESSDASADSGSKADTTKSQVNNDPKPSEVAAPVETQTAEQATQEEKTEVHSEDNTESKPQPENSNQTLDANKKPDNTTPSDSKPDTENTDSKPDTENTDSKPDTGNANKNPPPSGPNVSSSINVQEAFQAFTGFDDSTQMAVNNVFGVIEGMLEKMEKENHDTLHTEGDKKSSENHNKNEADKGESESHKIENDKGQAQMDEVKYVKKRLKKMQISGFILHDEKVTKASESTFSSERVENVVLEAMKVEVQRRLGSNSLKEFGDLNKELSKVASAVMNEIQDVRSYNGVSSPRKLLSAEGLVHSMASVFRETAILQQVVPFGVLVGVVLASLVNSFIVVTTSEKNWHPPKEKPNDPVVEALEEKLHENGGIVSTEEQIVPESGHHGGGRGGIIGAVTAAMGATAALASSGSGIEGKREEEENEDAHDEDIYKDNIVTNAAEKAFSIAAPVVPTKDGQIDHERLVSMLTELGHKAGFLNFLSKAALLWGGLRGAMNVTDRLLVFLRIADRPLHQRLMGFMGMVLVLWSPILLPLLPSLLNEWASRSSGGVAKYASVVGLYGAVIILVTIWGKRIRGYEQPLYEYGLRLKKRSLSYFGTGLLAGCTVVSLTYLTFNQLGLLKFAPSFMVTNTAAQTAISAVKFAKLVIEAVVIGVGVSVVEELIFRSWLLDEIAVDLGRHKAIMISSFLFALSHWSVSAIPGLWFLGNALAGARFKKSGNLALPIGLHAGLIATNFVLTCGGFIVYLPGPSWITGVHAGSPLAGVLGTAIAAVFAVLLYPWNVLIQEPHNNMGTAL